MNVTKLRADTPGCANRVHLNSAGASLMPGPVVGAIRAHLDLEASIGGYEAESEASVEIAAAYEDGLGDLEQLVLPPAPDVDPDHFDAYQNYEIEARDRDGLRTHLSNHGIGTLIQWNGTPVHQFEELGFTVDLPRTDELFTRCLLLPMNSMLTDDEVNSVISEIRSFYGA